MYVKNRMTANPFIVTPEATVAETLELMRSKKIRRVPVVKNGKLAGIISERQLLEVSPSPATSLSIFEINYLLSKTKIDSIMTKDVITVSPDSLLEEAALKMREHNVGGLPVVENGKVIGIITETDIFDSFVEILGFKDTNSSRIAIEIEDDRPGVLAQVAGIIAGYGVNITHLVIFRNELIVRVNTQNTHDIIKGLEGNGFRIISVTNNEF
ncbi:MAG: CBS domain-containing protein [Clostridiales bacterium]|nr:CBS domain-containing protein [Eubacteriales bacterium]MDH7565199.1 CBS domain-containing protein [Clostridiales bacterium]